MNPITTIKLNINTLKLCTSMKLIYVYILSYKVIRCSNKFEYSSKVHATLYIYLYFKVTKNVLKHVKCILTSVNCGDIKAQALKTKCDFFVQRTRGCGGNSLT